MTSHHRSQQPLPQAHALWKGGPRCTSFPGTTTSREETGEPGSGSRSRGELCLIGRGKMASTQVSTAGTLDQLGLLKGGNQQPRPQGRFRQWRGQNLYPGSWGRKKAGVGGRPLGPLGALGSANPRTSRNRSSGATPSTPCTYEFPGLPGLSPSSQPGGPVLLCVFS